ncbi:MAG: hypothetical protein ACOYN5_08845, partial [Bacteroidales bacterium]
MKSFYIKFGFISFILFISFVRLGIMQAQQLWGIGYSENNDSVFVYKLNIDGSDFAIVHKFKTDLVPVGGLADGNDGFVYGLFR